MMCWCAAASCSRRDQNSNTRTSQAGADTKHDHTPGPFDEQVLAVARNYKALTQASSNWNLAPTLCLPVIKPVELFMSDAKGDQAHSRKLYHLFVGDSESYLKAASTQAPTGQRLVKSSFEALPLPPDSDDPDGVRTSAGIFKPGEQKEFFVMLRLDAATADTDEGWVYGIVASDLSKTIASGRIQSCMECHTKRPSRLFGLKEQ